MNVAKYAVQCESTVIVKKLLPHSIGKVLQEERLSRSLHDESAARLRGVRLSVHLLLR